jgi:thiamine pyrophosphate-dependent acetolactate synthase large subunit-like protein
MPIRIGGHLVARALAGNGVRCVFTLCGGHIAPIYDGCLHEGIDIVDTRHEQAAAHAADAWARLTRGPGVAIVTAGPGVTDAVTGVANAMLAQSPLVVLGGAAELRLAGRGALQEMEQLPLMRSITKWSATVTDPRRLPEMVHTAIRQATTGIRGPVFLELPFDVLTAQVDDALLPPIAPVVPVGHAPADAHWVAEAAKIIARSHKPVLFVGSQIWWDDAAEVLRELVNRVGLPTVMNGMGRGALPASNPHALNLARKHAFRETDCLIVVGTPLDFRVGYGAGINANAKVIQLDRDPAQLGRNRAVDVGLVGDARSVLAQLESACVTHGARPERFEPWCETLLGAEDKAQAELQQWELADTRPINHYRLARAIADAIDEDTIVVGDGGDCVALAARVLAPERPGHWLDPGPLGCLGVGAPFALAAKKLYPDKKVLVLSGDGSFGLNGFDFETCVRFGLPVTVVVANDAAWGQIRGPQMMIFGPERAPATKLAPTRYDKVVEAFGGRGFHVEDPTQLTPIIREALASGQTTCVNVPIDPDFVQRIGASKLSV